MGRGLLGGLVRGMLVSGIALAVLSLSLPLPDRLTQPPDRMGAVAPGGAPAPEVAGAVSMPAPAFMPAPAPLRVPGPGPAVSADDRLAAVSAPGAAPALPGAEALPLFLSAPPRMVPGPARDLAPGAALSAPLPALPIARTPDQPMPSAVPSAGGPQLAASADAAAPVMAPSRVMAPERDRRPDVTGTAPPPAQMPAPALDPVDPPAVAPTAAPDRPLPGGPVGALSANAVDFHLPLDQPVLSVVLIDDPVSPLDAEMLSRIGFPVSLALDPARPDAAARAALLHAAGVEVVILAGAAIVAGAPSRDVAVALATAQAIMPQAVALIDHPDAPLQADPPALAASLAMLGGTGHGLIVFPHGPNAAEAAARQAGVAVATAFRMLDNDDQRAPLITRYLDRATFAAVQDGAVIVLGRTRPDTLAALVSWAVSARAAQVPLAPVSAALVRLNR